MEQKKIDGVSGENNKLGLKTERRHKEREEKKMYV